MYICIKVGCLISEITDGCKVTNVNKIKVWYVSKQIKIFNTEKEFQATCIVVFVKLFRYIYR